MVFQQLSVFSALHSNFQSKPRSASLNFGPGEDFSPMCGTLAPKEQEGSDVIAVRIADYGGNIDLRWGDIRENASDNQERLESLTLVS